MCCSYSLLFREQLGVGVSSASDGAWSEVYGERISAFSPGFDVGICSVAQCGAVIQLNVSLFSASRFLSARTAPCVAAHSLCPREEENGFLCHHFGQKQNKTEKKKTSLVYCLFYKDDYFYITSIHLFIYSVNVTEFYSRCWQYSSELN